MKWMDRALCRPPNISVRNGHAASIPGLIAMPVTIMSGSRMKITTPYEAFCRKLNLDPARWKLNFRCSLTSAMMAEGFQSLGLVTRSRRKWRFTRLAIMKISRPSAKIQAKTMCQSRADASE